LADAPDAVRATAPSGARFGHPAAGGPPGARGADRPGTETGAPGGAGAPEAGRGGAEPGARTPVLVAELIELRGKGRTGEAHALLCEAARWDAAPLAGLARELERAGLGADWATLLWEAASLPPDRLAALAAALSDAGRTADCERLLRQGAARPAPEIAEAALALGAAGRSREADALLTAFVRVRTAEEAAALARRDPRWFAPRLLAAARGLAGSAHRDLVHAFRVAKIASTG
ncbi:UL36 very large tegument protein, partial [Streptomyces sp. NPDC059917]